MGMASSLFRSDPFNSKANYDSLRRAVTSGDAVVFAGAGISRAEGVLGWQEIAKSIVEDKLVNYFPPGELEQILRETNPYDIMELYAQIRGRTDFIAELRELLNEPTPSPSALEIHCALIQLPLPFLVTTNWDSLFRQASRSLPAPELTPVYNDTTFLQYYGRQSPLLLKPHGDLSALNPVVTLKDLYTHEKDNPVLAGFVRDLFLTKTLLFIGYGLEDPDFRRYFFRYSDELQAIRKSHYILTIGEPEFRCRFYETLGLKVMHLNKPDNDDYRPLYAQFATKLLEDTALHVTDPLERARKIASRFRSYRPVRADLRVRAGLSAIGIPQPSRQGSPYITTTSDGSHDKTVHAPWSKDMYEAKLELNKAFRAAVSSALENGHMVWLILATDFETMQQRASDPRWAACCLESLMAFFAEEEGKDSRVVVVDRDGPYEIQQYIIGHKEVIESRKLVKPEYPYYESRVLRTVSAVEDCLRQFDSCFESFRLEVFENMLLRARGPGFDYLVKRICAGEAEPLWRNEEDLKRQAEAVVRTTSGTGEVAGPSLDEKAVWDLVESARDSIRDLTSALKANSDEERLTNVRHLLSCEPPYMLLVALRDEVVNTTVKKYLLGKWEREREQLLGGRSPRIRIRMLDAEHAPAGSIEKRRYHLMLSAVRDGDYLPNPLEYKGDHGTEHAIWNSHVSCLAITGDAKHLVLRHCLGTDRRDDPHLDPDKLDRTVGGHVRYGHSEGIELRDEILHHLETQAWPGAKRDYNALVSKDDFLKECRSRHEGISKEVRLLILRLGGPLQAPYLRTRWYPSNENELPTSIKEESILEPVISMPYLLLLPPQMRSLNDLPKTPNDHAAGWTLLDWRSIELIVTEAKRFGEERLPGELWLPLPDQRANVDVAETERPSCKHLSWELVHTICEFAEAIGECLESKS